MAEMLKSELDSTKIGQPIKTAYGQLSESIGWLLLDEINDTFSYSDFSLSELGKDKPVALFLQFDETKFESLGFLLSFLYGHFLNCLIANASDRGAVVLFLDEIGNIPTISGLKTKLNTIGSRKILTFTYWQSVSQMVDKYGPKADETILTSAELQIYFRQNTSFMMEWVSRLVGDRSVRKISYNKTEGATSHGSTTYAESFERVIKPHEVGSLDDGKIITVYSQGVAIGRAVPYYKDYRKLYDSSLAKS